MSSPDLELLHLISELVADPCRLIVPEEFIQLGLRTEPRVAQDSGLHRNNQLVQIDYQHRSYKPMGVCYNGHWLQNSDCHWVICPFITHITHLEAILKEVIITAVDIFAVFNTIPYGKRFMI